MPEDKYNTGGFSQTTDGAIFPNLSDELDRPDAYNGWDWKQIMAAILGSSQGDNTPANADHRRGIADPQSLQDAADAFYFVQRTLEQVASVMADQTKALAGPDGPWRGDAADVFHDTIDNFSKRIAAAADALAGGKSGQNSVPQQLANNAVALKWAQETVVAIDNWYAQLSLNYGMYHNQRVGAMKDGRIPIHDVKVGNTLIEPLMQNDMYQVAKTLSGNFSLTVDNVKLPDSVNGPKTDGGNGDLNPPKVDPPPATGGGGDVKVPPLGGGLSAGGGDGLPGYGGNLSKVPGLDDTGGSATPFPGSTLATDTGGGLGDVPPFDTGNLDAALSPGGPDASASPFPGDTSAFPGGDTSAFPGGDLPGDFAASPFPGDTSALPGGEVFPGDTSALPGGEAFPGDTSLGEGGQNPSAFTATPFPGLTGLPVDAAAVPSTSSGLTDASESPFGEAGLPQDYPGDLGLGAAGGLPAVSAADLPADTAIPSALPGNAALESPGTLPDTTPAEFPGSGDASAGAGQQQGGAGMPYMPGMGGFGGAGGGAGQGALAEPPDAAGLLDASSVPWGEGVGGAGDVSEFGGAPVEPGVAGEVPGLDLPESTPAEFSGAGEADGRTPAAAGAGMPYMPGMG
ncbi:WXG100 family type VII secretion target, partial [Streptomyces sp. NPDC017676]|uniref:WXG100 family type VII secretion target n=2 Tax=unclassified Streptomyces TaxID=2593676 RepID=UPI00379F8793